MQTASYAPVIIAKERWDFCTLLSVAPAEYVVECIFRERAVDTMGSSSPMLY